MVNGLVFTIAENSSDRSSRLNAKVNVVTVIVVNEFAHTEEFNHHTLVADYSRRILKCERVRTICEQFFAEHRNTPSSNSNEEHRRTNKVTYLDYLDTVEVIGSIPVAPIFSKS